MRTCDQTLAALLDCGIIPVIRAASSQEAVQAAEAVLAGGVRTVEITFTVPGAAQVIADIHARFGDQIVLGAGTVLTMEQAQEAISAGAEFIVSPNINPAVIQAVKCAGGASGRQRGMVSVPGAFSPTEVVAALEAGADLVKIFPINVLGAGYLKDLRGPLPGVKLVPTGGITLDNAADYFRAGAAAIGVGGSLVDQKALRAGRPEVITDNARRFVEVVKRARTEM